MIYEDYEEYLKQQIIRAESKWGRKPTWNNIFKEKLSDLIDWSELTPTSVCCMGVRDGTELWVFKQKFPEAKVWGIDITKNIDSIKHKYPVTIKLQDFNKLPEDFPHFDLIYSNSIDHAFDPEITLKEWARVGSYLLLEFFKRETNIEHGFDMEYIKKLPYEILKSKELEDRNIVLFKV